MEKFVDVKKLIESKNKKLAGWIPGFVVRYIQRIIHQDEVNEFFHQHKNSDVYEFCAGTIDYFNFQIGIVGKGNIPAPPENCIFVANHPLGGMDAIAVIDGFKDVRRDIKFIVNDLLMNVRNLSDQFVGVNKVGKNAKESLKRVEEQFASDTATFLFPAGLVSRKINGEIKDLEWQKTFISKARKYQKQVVPVYIEGRLTNRFYRLANFRKWLGIKINFEMFFLVDELFRQKNMKMDIIVGEPIPVSTFDRSKQDKEWAQWVKEEVYKLGDRSAKQ